MAWCFKHKSKWIKKYYIKSKNFLFWGAALRFIFESYLEIGLCVTIGLVTMEWNKDNFAVFYNNIFTFGLLIAILIMPLYTSIFYGWNI